MTILDNDRGYARPVEEVALGLRDLFMETVEQTSGKPFQDTGVAVPGDDVWSRYASRAIVRLRKLGFISDLGIAAIEAEEQAGKGVVR